MVNVDLSTIEMTCYYIAGFSTVFFIIKTAIFAITGGDSEVLTDFNSEVEFETSFNFVSLQTILAFLMGFGWMALGCMKWGLNVILSVLIAFIFGLVLMFGTAYLMFLVKKLNKHVTKDYSKTVGTVGKAYTNFAPSGKGKIEINVNGALSIEDAINSSTEEIKSFTPIKVTEYKDKIMYVEIYKGEN